MTQKVSLLRIASAIAGTARVGFVSYVALLALAAIGWTQQPMGSGPASEDSSSKVATTEQADVQLAAVKQSASSPVENGQAVKQVAWHHPLYLDWGGYWQKRIRITIHNDGTTDLAGMPVTLAIGSASTPAANSQAGEGQPTVAPPPLPLAGELVRSLRVCTADGAELLWAVYDPAGSLLQEGRIAAGSRLVLPAACPTKSSQDLFVYFDNRLAGEVPDYLELRPILVNGGVEAGVGDTPLGWRHDPGDERRRAFWTEENPHAGKKCLAIAVQPGTPPSWIATRQNDLAVVPGARYRFRAWVRAKDVDGYAGWYLHVGNQENPLMLAPTFSAGGGTYDWKEVSGEVTIPAEANRASLGTLLWGTGQAWFDDAEWEMVGQLAYRVVVHAPETCVLEEVSPESSWPTAESAAGDIRYHIQFLNFQNAPRDVLACLSDARMHSRRWASFGAQGVRVAISGQLTTPVRIGDYLLWPETLSPRSRTHRYIYSAPGPRDLEKRDELQSSTPPAAGDSASNKVQQGETAGQSYLALLHSKQNLVRDPSFEDGPSQADVWLQSGSSTPGVRFSLDNPGKDFLGQHAARLDVLPEAKSGWWGWQQRVAIQPGRTYLIAGWLKCENLKDEARIHIHFHDAGGQLVKDGGMTSVGTGIRGTQPWTLLSGLVTTPLDAATLTLHLTMNTTGTIWHDGIIVCEVMDATSVAQECKPLPENAVVAWQVPAVVKVFREDPPDAKRSSAKLAVARGEWESLQLAVRSARQFSEVRVEVVPPQNAHGERLENFEVGVIGYVPIDCPTNYYRVEVPDWQRKIPRGQGSSDGWAGWWPDPILPRSTFSLPAETTQPVWVIFKVSREATPGDYEGAIRFRAGDAVLAEVPLRVTVWKFVLPATASMPAIYDARLGPGSALWGKPIAEMYEEIVRFMAERRLCPDRIRVEPRFFKKDGQIQADFTEYDRQAEWYFNELHLPVSYAPNTFYLFGWGFPPREFLGEQPYPGSPPYEGVDRGELRAEYKTAYQTCLKLYWDHMKAKGWQDRIVLYISDEPFDHLPEIRAQMVALCRMIHEVDPAIPIYSSTWHHVPDWDGSITLWGLGHDGRVPPDKLREILAAGAKVWFTTDGQMCTDTPYCAVERLLPHYCFHYGVSAYEFWGVAWTTYDPYRFGWHSFIPQSDRPGVRYWVRYPNGDGFLLYPGRPIGYEGIVSSIRLEQAREGVEDYEYLKLLSAAMERAKAEGRATAQAQEVLADAARLVPMPNAGGRFSTKVLTNPEDVERVRQRVAEAIESLGPQ